MAGQVSSVARSSVTVNGPVEGHVAGVGDEEAVGEDVADAGRRSPSVDVLSMVSAGVWVAVIGHRVRSDVTASPPRRAVAGGGVGDRAGVEVGLGDGVGGGAGDARPGARVGGAGQVVVRGAVVGHGERTGQGDVAGVGDHVACRERCRRPSS